MATVYIVVGDVAAHSGHISECDTDDSRWTYQDVCRAHGTVLGEFATRAEAVACLEAWEQCSSKEDGYYCYTHNPSGR